MLRHLLPESVEMRVDLNAGASLVKIDPGQFQQVVVNLVVNARDAMPKGGILEIRTATENPYDETAARIQQDRSYVALTVEDTGCGIDPGTLDHIFDPFFTTKDLGRGVGLGLSVVHGIAKQSGGTLHVSSKPGAGTTIQLRLPTALPGDVGAPADELSQSNAAVRGSETVLLVEDEEVVRATVREGLQDLGYAVLEADRPSKALELSRGHPEKIRQVLDER